MENTQTKISIVVPIYNTEKYLEKCMESIIKQTYKNLEIILVDDGSTDKSAEIMKHYAKIDKRIINVFQENMGAPSARNKGINMATGKYIMLFDSDDELYLDSIENMVNNISDADIVIGNWCKINENGKLIATILKFKNNVYINEDINNIADCNPFPCNKLYKTEIIKKNNIYFEKLRIAQDLNFFLKFISVCNKVVTIDNIVFKYRVRDNSISRTYNLNVLDIVNSIENAERYIKNIKNSVIKKSTINKIKIMHYANQLNKYKKFNKVDRKIVSNYFYKRLKEIETKGLNLLILLKRYTWMIKSKVLVFMWIELLSGPKQLIKYILKK